MCFLIPFLMLLLAVAILLTIIVSIMFAVHFEKKSISKRGKCILQSKVKFNIINTSDDNLATTVIIIIFCGRMILKLITILLLPEQLNYFPYNRTMVVNSCSIL